MLQWLPITCVVGLRVESWMDVGLKGLLFGLGLGLAFPAAVASGGIEGF